MRLTDLLALSHVPRWSIVEHSRPQSVADHTFRTLVIAVELADRLGVVLGREALSAILVHDGPECRTSDIPSPVMNKFRALMGSETAEWSYLDWALPVNVPDEQFAIFKLADKIEGYTFIAKYGVGPHAEAVAAHCYAEIVRMAALSDNVKLDSIVKSVMADIMMDRGRDRVFPY